MLNRLTSYFQGVAAELRKVVWPTVPTLVRHFLAVVIGISLLTVLVGAIDYLFIKALPYIIK
jgi:preprotein translocase subunit SecE